MEPRIGIIGAGWAGVSTAHRLAEAGVAAEVFEKTDVVGGHSRSEIMKGVAYEPNDAHIFRTSDEKLHRPSSGSDSPDPMPMRSQPRSSCPKQTEPSASERSERIRGFARR